MRDYPRLEVEHFGVQLIESGDLDPVYIMLHKAEMEEPQLARWLIAYWCLYSCGEASWLSQQTPDVFWAKLMDAAHNRKCPRGEGTRWSRGHERRHWRGANAVAGAASLQTRLKGDPSNMLFELLTASTERPIPFAAVSAQVQLHQGFGPWMAFKVADMLDRLGLAPVDFSTDDVMMYEDPRKAALMLWRSKQGFADTVRPKDERRAIQDVVAYLTKRFGGWTAPPLHDRAINIQEVETILCKWKSHMNGHYPLGNDIREIGAGLELWSEVSPTAKLLRGFLPELKDETHSYKPAGDKRRGQDHRGRVAGGATGK